MGLGGDKMLDLEIFVIFLTLLQPGASVIRKEISSLITLGTVELIKLLENV